MQHNKQFRSALLGLRLMSILLLAHTLAYAAVPTVQKTAPTNVSNTATVGANILSDGGFPITSSGVVYGTFSNPSLGDPGVTDSTTTPVVTSGSYSFILSGLTPGTKYYYRAYAINSDGTGYSAQQDSFTTDPLISSLPYTENFDGTGNTGWKSVATGGTNDWVVGTPAKTQLSAAYSSPNAWVTKLSGDYSSSSNAAVVSPQFDFSSLTLDPVLRFRQNFISENNWDAVVLEMSVNNGTWTKVDATVGTGTNFNTTISTSWYNNTSTSGPITPPKWSNNSNGYSSQSSNWIQSQTVLTGAAGQSNVRFRFRFGSDGSGTREGWAIDNIEVVNASAPVVVTGVYDNLTTVEVRLAGSVSNNGGAVVTTSGVVIGTSPSPSIGDPGVIDSANHPVVTSGSYQLTVKGLTAGTTYYYRAYAINGVGTGYGADNSFTTFATPQVPTVSKTAPSSITSTTATVGGNVTLDGGDAVTASGVVYGTSSNPSLGDPGVVDSTTTPLKASGAYTFTLGGLTPGTKYYYRAYATNSAGTGYSAQQDSFMTDPVISTLPYSENFDVAGNNTGWTSVSISGTNDWVMGTPSKTRFNAAYSTPNAWVTRLTGNYTSSSNAAVLSPLCNFSALTVDPIVRFRHNFLTEAGYDGAILEISINNGTWTKLDANVGTGGNFNTSTSTSWYNSTSTNGPVTPPKWSGNSNAYSSQVSNWIQSQTILTGAAGQSNVRFRFRFATDPSGTNEGWIIDNIEVVNPVVATVTTGGSSNITTANAQLAGSITANGGAIITSSGVVVGTSPSPAKGDPGVIDSLTNPVVTSGSFSVNITGLSPGTTYYYRAYAVNGVGVAYGSDGTFTTNAAATSPNVQKNAPANISAYVATVSGTIISDGGDPIIASGVVYGTSSNPSIGDPGVVDSTTTPVITSGTYSFTLAGLTPNTIYYYRAYAINGVGTAYSAQQDSFTTAGVITSLPYTENFDGGGSTGWASVATGGANDWVMGSPSKTRLTAAYSSPNAWVTSLTGNYSNNANAAVVSPQFDFSTSTIDPVVKFRQNFIVESGWDGAVLEISINNGTWTRLNSVLGTGSNFNTNISTSWYNNNSTNGPLTPPKWSDTSNLFSSHVNKWIQSITTLTGAAGQSNVRFRIRFASDGSGVREGWAFDDVLVLDATAPVVTTGMVTNISTSEAQVSGSVDGNGGALVTTSGIVIGTSPSPSIGAPGVIDSVTSPVVTSGSFHFNLAGLNASTTYYYRVYATNAVGTEYGTDSVFTTNAVPVLASVQTSSATNIGGYVATVGGNILLDGGDPITVSGVVYGTSPDPAIGDPGVVDSTTTPLVTTGTYSFALIGLSPSTKYYYRAYAINGVGTAYSIQDSFTTGMVVSSLPYNENFDGGGSTGWNSVATGGANDWVLGSPSKTRLTAAYSSPNAWVTSLTGNYSNNSNAAVVSPQFDFSASALDPIVRFRQNFISEAGWDGAVLEISINNGAWTKLNATAGTGSNFNTTTSISWYNNTSTNGPITPPKWSDNSNLFSSQASNWIQSSTYLTGAAGQSNVKFRIRFGSDGSGVREGWAIDDIQVVDITAPIVVTGTSTNITTTIATLSGSITDNGGAAITRSGIVFSTNPTPVIGDPGVIDSTTTPLVTSGSFSVNTTGLTAGTTYYYRSYAINAVGTSYGSDNSFTTFATPQLPTVQKNAPSVITTTTAITGGSVILDGGDAIIASGIVYGTSSNPSIGDPGVVDSTTTPLVSSGSFSFTLGGLLPNTTYYYRAYAINGVGTGYSADQDSFTTDPIISSFPYTENFDGTGKTGWTTVATGGANDWVLGTPAKTQLSAAYSSPNAWVTRLTGNYSSNANAAIVSPQLDFSGVTSTAVVRFMHNFITENNYDAAVLEVSINNGPWRRPDSTLGTGTNFNTSISNGWYNNNSTSGPMVPPKWSNNSNGYATQSGNWIQSQTVLAGTAGQSNVKFRIRFATDGSGTNEGWAVDNIEVFTATVPIVTTGTYTNLTSTNVQLTGNISNNGGSAITVSGIVVGTSANPVVGGAGVVDVSTFPLVTSGSFQLYISGLTPGTSYFYRTYATNSIGIAYGPDSTFTTNATSTVPDITTDLISNVTTTTATIGGMIITDGGDAITTSGVVYSTSPNPTVGGPGVIDSVTAPAVLSGSYHFNITGLTSNTMYYVKAYAVNGVGIGYGIEDSFMTDPVISTFPYSEDFDGGAMNNGWKSVSTGGINEWVMGAPSKTRLTAAFSSPNAWVTKLSGNYSDNSNAAIVSPQLDFSSVTTDPVVRFMHNFITEANYDGAVVEISVNNGTWRRLDSIVGTGGNFNTASSIGWYNNTSTSGPMVPAKWSSNSNAYSSQASNWIQSSTRLTGAAGQSNVKFRIRFATDGSGNNEGWAVDNIEVFELQAPTVQASVVTISNITNNTIDVSWANGNGDARIVVVHETSVAAVAPTDWTLYNANAQFGSGDATGSGNYIVYKGTGSSLTVTGLTNFTSYTFDVYEMNGTLMQVRFMTPPASNIGVTPVKLTSFTAQTVAKDVVVNWSTASEVNNKGFNVERSRDGKTFGFAGFVKGAGNSNQLNSYAFTDINPFIETEVLYYRLQQLDVDGKYEYSPIVRVNKTAATITGVVVSPNPYTDNFTVEINAAEEGTMQVDVYDMQGKLLFTKTAHVVKGIDRTTITELNTINAGIYFVKVTMNGETTISRIMKTN